MGCPGWGLPGAEVLGEGLSLVPGWEGEHGRSRDVARAGCGGGRVALWGLGASSPAAGVRAVRMSALKARDRIQHMDAERHWHFLSGAAAVDAGFVLPVSVQETPWAAPRRQAGTRSRIPLKLFLGVITCKYLIWGA